MIVFNFKKKITNPHKQFLKLYEKALSQKQKFIEAACISTTSPKNRPHSRFVNIKYLNEDEIIFFSNYDSQKAKDVLKNNNVAVAFFWNSAYVQIRVEGKIKKLSSKDSDLHWNMRKAEKNALAIASNQSRKIESYSKIQKKYLNVFKNNDLTKRPDYWGGYTIKPTYFEFWEGNENRINKRYAFKFKNGRWKSFYLEP